MVKSYLKFIVWGGLILQFSESGVAANSTNTPPFEEDDISKIDLSSMQSPDVKALIDDLSQTPSDDSLHKDEKTASPETELSVLPDNTLQSTPDLIPDTPSLSTNEILSDTPTPSSTLPIPNSASLNNQNNEDGAISNDSSPESPASESQPILQPNLSNLPIVNHPNDVEIAQEQAKKRITQYLNEQKQALVNQEIVQDQSMEQHLPQQVLQNDFKNQENEHRGDPVEALDHQGAKETMQESAQATQLTGNDIQPQAPHHEIEELTLQEKGKDPSLEKLTHLEDQKIEQMKGEAEEKVTAHEAMKEEKLQEKSSLDEHGNVLDQDNI